jgi:hypothetical protein
MRIWKNLLLCLAGSAGFILSLEFITSYGSRYPNGFNRLFPPHALSAHRILRLEHKEYYIAGMDSRYIYLGSYLLPFEILRVDFSLKERLPIQIPVPPHNHLHGPAMKVQVDSPNIFLVDQNNGIILSSSLSNPGHIAYLPTRLKQAVMAYQTISASSLIIRIVDPAVRSAVLAKLNPGREPELQIHDILEKQIDGIFCTDGMLHYDQQTGKLVYVYFYRNQYIGMDSNLQIEFRGKTLDSNSHAKIHIAYIASENKTTMAEPPFSVNKLSAVDGHYLFIQSALLSEHEEAQLFKNNAVIDVYDLTHRVYRFSFYLPYTGREKMQDFRVSFRRLITLHGAYLEIYQFKADYLLIR